MNSREIGAVLGLPEGTVRTRLMRARAELRARWEVEQEAKQAAARQRTVGQERGAAVG